MRHFARSFSAFFLARLSRAPFLARPSSRAVSRALLLARCFSRAVSRALLLARPSRAPFSPRDRQRYAHRYHGVIESRTAYRGGAPHRHVTVAQRDVRHPWVDRASPSSLGKAAFWIRLGWVRRRADPARCEVPRRFLHRRRVTARCRRQALWPRSSCA